MPKMCVAESMSSDTVMYIPAKNLQNQKKGAQAQEKTPPCRYFRINMRIGLPARRCLSTASWTTFWPLFSSRGTTLRVILSCIFRQSRKYSVGLYSQIRVFGIAAVFTESVYGSRQAASRRWMDRGHLAPAPGPARRGQSCFARADRA